MDTAFRTKQDIQPQQEEQLPKATTPAQGPIDDGVEVPFSSYTKAHQKPYTVEHFGLSELWDDPEGGFQEEVGTLERYLQHQIERGEVMDSVESVKKELKRLEKENDLQKEDRVTIKLGILSAYAKFLMETDGVKFNWRKYAGPK